MKTSSKKMDKSQVELKVTIDAEEAGAIIKNVEKIFAREAQIPGFRKGKVPMNLIRKEFASSMKQEINQSLYQKNIDAAIKEEKIEAVAVVELKELSCTEEGGAFTVIIDAKPEFKLPTYKGLKVEFRDTTVSEDKVQEQMKRLREAYSTYEDAKEGDTVDAGDFVQIDYNGTVDGKAILEINPEAKFVASGTGFWTQVEEGRFLPELLDALKGMKIGETKENIKAKFDKESAPEGLKGAKAVYTLTLKSFRRRVLPDDATFAEKAQAESIEKLTADIRERMEKNAKDEEQLRRENEAIELLLKKADFEVPQSQVNNVVNSYLQQFAERAQYSGLDASYFEKNMESIQKEAQENAVKQVRTWYLIEAIAKAENIIAEDKDDKLGKKVVDFLLANAKK